MNLPSVACWLAALACAGVAQATERVGRTSFELGGWSPVARFDTRLTFNGGEYTLPVRNALYQLPGSGKVPRALLLVSSTDGGNRQPVDWISDRCPPPNRNFYTRDYAGAAVKSHRECLIVNSGFVPAKLFAPESPVMEALRSQGLEFFRTGYSLRTAVALRSGTLLRINLMTQRDFAGLPGRPVEGAQPHDVPAHLLAWGEALHARARQSALSLGGTLELPPIHFSR